MSKSDICFATIFCLSSHTHKKLLSDIAKISSELCGWLVLEILIFCTAFFHLISQNFYIFHANDNELHDKILTLFRYFTIFWNYCMCAEENEGRENSSHGFDYISLVRKCFCFWFLSLYSHFTNCLLNWFIWNDKS